MNKDRIRTKRTVLIAATFLTVGSASMHAAAVPDAAAIAQANNAFAADLYGLLKPADGNLFLSPYSISLAFGMAWCGAGGETASQMAKVLHFEGDPAQVAAGQGALQELLNGIQAKGDIKLAIANSIWPEKSYPFRPDYLTTLREHFAVSVTPCDFRTQPDVERLRINQWVEDQTNDKIKDLLPAGSINAMTRLVLANAIYFKGNWQHQFTASATKDEPFFLASGSQVKVPLMTQKTSFRYAEHPGLQVLSMPYAGGELSMIVLLPEAKDGLASLENELTAGMLGEWAGRLRTSEVTVHFPKFKVESSFELNRTMVALGMKDAFAAGRADFSGMTERNDLFISDAVHKAFVEVNEEGTEAAAATGIAMRLASAQPRPVVFRADHPFLYFIRHDATGAILFMGRMMDPTG
jgi:serpin B